MDEIRYVSKQTQQALEDAERKNPNGIAVVVEENPSEQIHEDFKDVVKKDITEHVIGIDKVFGESLLNKGEKKMENNEKKFLSFIAFNDKIVEQQGKSGERYCIIRCRRYPNGEPLNGVRLSFLLSAKRRKETKNPNISSFWLFADEKIKVSKRWYNQETKEWVLTSMGEFNADEIVEMMKTK